MHPVVLKDDRIPVNKAAKEQRRRNKPVYDGLKQEKHVFDELIEHGVNAWRRPGQRFVSVTTGGNYAPDAAANVTGLGKYGVRSAPSRLKVPRPDANVIVEVKSQRVAGSVDRKLIPAIDDLAHAADISRVVPILVLDTPALSNAAMQKIYSWAEVSLVAVVTKEELELVSGWRILRSRMVKVAVARKTLRAKTYAATGNIKPNVKRNTGTQASRIMDAYAARHMRANFTK